MDLRYNGVKKDKKYYVAYYATENITPATKTINHFKPGSEESLRKYGDLNGLCNECAWLTLYTTKDANAGTPLLADFKISDKNNATDGYKGVHIFSYEAAANLNQLQMGNSSEVYLFMKHSVVSNTQEPETQEPKKGTGSVFVENPSVNVVLAFGIFVIGALVSGFTVAGYYKKKEKVAGR